MGNLPFIYNRERMSSSGNVKFCEETECIYNIYTSHGEKLDTHSEGVLSRHSILQQKLLSSLGKQQWPGTRLTLCHTGLQPSPSWQLTPSIIAPPKPNFKSLNVWHKQPTDCIILSCLWACLGWIYPWPLTSHLDIFNNRMKSHFELATYMDKGWFLITEYSFHWYISLYHNTHSIEIIHSMMLQESALMQFIRLISHFEAWGKSKADMTEY